MRLWPWGNKQQATDGPRRPKEPPENLIGDFQLITKKAADNYPLREMWRRLKDLEEPPTEVQLVAMQAALDSTEIQVAGNPKAEAMMRALLKDPFQAAGTTPDAEDSLRKISDSLAAIRDQLGGQVSAEEARAYRALHLALDAVDLIHDKEYALYDDYRGIAKEDRDNFMKRVDMLQMRGMFARGIGAAGLGIGLILALNSGVADVAPDGDLSYWAKLGIMFVFMGVAHWFGKKDAKQRAVDKAEFGVGEHEDRLRFKYGVQPLPKLRIDDPQFNADPPPAAPSDKGTPHT